MGVPDSQLKACRLANAIDNMLFQLTKNNLDAQEAMLRYDARECVRLFRIRSDIIPFASHPAIRFS